MSGGMFSSGAGGPVGGFISSTARPAVSASTQARMSQFVVAKPMDATPTQPAPNNSNDEPRSPVFGGDESMDMPTVDVPSTDPWASQDATPAAKPHKHRGMRKSAMAAASMKATPAQQEAWPDSESDDEDFAPGEDKDSDGGNSDSGSDDDDDDDDDDDGDSDSDDNIDDDDEHVSAPRKKKHVAESSSLSSSSSAAAAAIGTKKRSHGDQDKQSPPKQKGRRPTKAEMLREMEIKLFGRAADDEDEGEGDWIDDDDDEEDGDDDEHSSDYEGIVRDDADRLQDALSFKASVVVSKSDPEQALLASGNDLNALMANYSKERDRVAFNKLMEGMAHAGFDVNAEAPDIPEEEFERRAKKKASEDAAAAAAADPESMDDDDDDDNNNADPEPEESPIHRLVPELIMMLEKDEIDLPEQLAKLCHLVFNKMFFACRGNPTGASIDLGKDMLQAWGASASSSQFYGRCRRMIAFIMNKTRSRFNSHLITAFAGAFNSTSLCEFVPAKFVINEAHERHQSAYRCASCARDMPRHPMAGSIGLHYLPGIELFQHKQVPITRPTGTLHATSPLLSRPQSNTDTTKQFLLCATCAPVMPIMNQLLTAGHDIAYLARAWIEEHREAFYVQAQDQATLSDAFHQDARRQKLCQSIIWAYKMMHAVALT